MSDVDTSPDSQFLSSVVVDVVEVVVDNDDVDVAGVVVDNEVVLSEVDVGVRAAAW